MTVSPTASALHVAGSDVSRARHHRCSCATGPAAVQATGFGCVDLWRDYGPAHGQTMVLATTTRLVAPSPLKLLAHAA